MKINVFSFGNSARGDDAAGEIMHQWLSQLLASEEQGYGEHEIQLFYDFQLQPEHIFDLESCDTAIFIDCQISAEATLWAPVLASTQISFSSHSLDMESLLFLYQTSIGKPPPPCYFLGIGGQQFELGSAPSRSLEIHIEQAKRLLCEKLAQLGVSYRHL